MTELAALTLTYGLVWAILLIYVTRLWRRLQQLATGRQHIRSGSSPRPMLR